VMIAPIRPPAQRNCFEVWRLIHDDRDHLTK